MSHNVSPLHNTHCASVQILLNYQRLLRLIFFNIFSKTHIFASGISPQHTMSRNSFPLHNTYGASLEKTLNYQRLLAFQFSNISSKSPKIVLITILDSWLWLVRQPFHDVIRLKYNSLIFKEPIKYPFQRPCVKIALTFIILTHFG